MWVASYVFAVAAAALHVYIFWLESWAWERPSTRAVFGITSEAEARTTRPLAFNQGFYNLFLAITAAAGVGLMLAGHTAVGATLVFAGAGSMLAAAVVLASTGRRYAKAATVQGTLPGLAVVTLVMALL
ncbi:DUF1304 domain-containing protein [Demequina sp. B12]|uniref:DUF1304 domain-containing protein n=1 Tax=Demequina sp. B12 TaxID=2992757 RepID=UPI00237AE7ED|nr:DUF1304 domain-containing protein [Demequina sp. B12]MDE0573504.1 DUF1304 domain-containing protein [Demequina sp. B12]